MEITTADTDNAAADSVGLATWTTGSDTAVNCVPNGRIAISSFKDVELAYSRPTPPVSTVGATQ